LPRSHARLSRRAAVLLISAMLGCTASPRVIPVLPEPPPPVIDIDPLPGSVAELETIAHDASAPAERVLAALQRLAVIHHAEAAIGPDRAPDAAAANALRRMIARDPSALHVGRMDAALVAALAGSGAAAEADALQRHLACPSGFRYSPSLDGVAVQSPALPQDHDPHYWAAWEALHPRPLDAPPLAQPVARAPRTAHFVPLDGGPDSPEAETRYVSLYGKCRAASPNPASSDEAAQLARAWIAVGDAHRLRDAQGGPLAILRAIEAYEHAVVASTGASGEARNVLREATLRLGEALHARERFHAAVDALTRWLTACDDATACASAEREHALILIADSLLRVDFEGPPPSAPAIPRVDVVEMEASTTAGRKLRVALDRAANPAIIPLGTASPFAPALLAALAQEYGDLGLYDEQILAFERLEQLFPSHRDLPRVLAGAARAAGNAAKSVQVWKATPSWIRALLGWEALAALVAPGSPWRAANANDVEALAEATRREGEVTPEVANVLEALAASLATATRTEDPLPLDDATALGYLRRAARAWTPMDVPGASGAHARTVLADLSTAELAWLTRTKVDIDPARWAAAWAALERTRDDPDAVARRANAARKLVDLHLRYEEARFTASHGKLGLEPRARTLRAPFHPPAVEHLPVVVEDAARARDGLVAATASSGSDREKIDALTAAAGLVFAYGQTGPAGDRLLTAARLVCQKPAGFEAFELAARVARAAGDRSQLARLATLHADPSTTCAKSRAEIARGRALTR